MSDAIWLACERFSDEVHRIAKIRQLRANLAQVKCGDCSRWMTRNCPREKNGNMRGYSIGPSCNGVICDQFDEKHTMQKLREEWRAELNALLDAARARA